jgi:hypothetical protein
MKSGSERTSLGVVAIIGVLYVIPIILANRPYIDDLRRSLTGEGAWTINARPLSDALMIVLSMGHPLADLAPLTQIGAVGLYCAACVLLFKWTAGMAMPAVWRALACTALLLSPFLLQNNAYRFDSLPMAAAFFACMWAARPRSGNPVLALLRSAALVFVGLCIYQAAANVTAAVAMLLLLVETRRSDAERDIWTRLGVRLGGLVLASLVYSVTVGPLLIRGRYTLAHAERVPLTLDGVQQMLENFGRATLLVWNSFDLYQLLLLSVAGIIALATVGTLLAVRLRSGKTSWALTVACVLGVAGLWLTPLGLSGTLQAPVLQPRVLMAFGIVLAFVLLFAAEGLSTLRRPAVAAAVRALGITGLFAFVAMPLLVCLSFAYAFGSAQARQDEADMALVAEIRTGLSALAVHDEFYLAVDGQQPMAPAATRTVQRFPLLTVILPRYLEPNSYWSMCLLRYHGIPARFDAEKSEQAIAQAKQQVPGYVGMGFDLTLAGDTVVLRFPG